MYRKANETKLKKYWFCLFGRELYCYRKKDDDNQKTMQSMTGVHIKECPMELHDNRLPLYPIKLIFPPSKSKTYYLLTEQEQAGWVSAIK